MAKPKGTHPSPQDKESHHGPANVKETVSHRRFDASLLASRIEERLGFVRFEHITKHWLKTGSKRLNAVLGSRDKGIAYGKMIEMRGMEHGGKTLLAIILAAKAQKDGAGIGRIDLENSQDDDWDKMFGLDPTSVVTIRPDLGYVGNKGKQPKVTKDSIPVMKSAEQIFSEAQMGMHLLRKMGFKKQFWYVDSIAQVRTKMQIDVGNKDKNMRTRNDRAMFLSDVLPEWVALAAGYNACIVFINQLRNSMAMFGDPESAPGGRALRHNLHVQVKIRKVKSGKLIHHGRKVGLMGKIQNFKNKSGGGSESDLTCGFKIRWDVKPPQIQFMAVEDVEDSV